MLATSVVALIFAKTPSLARGLGEAMVAGTTLYRMLKNDLVFDVEVIYRRGDGYEKRFEQHYGDAYGPDCPKVLRLYLRSEYQRRQDPALAQGIDELATLRAQVFETWRPHLDRACRAAG